MKKYWGILCIVGLMLLPIALRAEEIILVCKYDNGTEMMPIKVNLKTKNAGFEKVDGSGWKLVGNLDRYITMRSTDTESTVGGTIMVVDRFTGEFVISYVNFFPEDKKISGMTAKGLCNKKQF